MFTKFSARKFAVSLLTPLVLILAACAPSLPVPQTGSGSTPTPTTAAPLVETPVSVYPGLNAEDILLQLDYEPGFVLPEYRFPFGRVPFFTLLADGRVIYIDENQDFKVMQVQLSQEEAAALLLQVREMGFEQLKSHTDFCGKMADGTESCIADASTTIMRVRMADGSLREIRNYANFSNGPTTYEAIYNLMNEYTNAEASLYEPHAATLFVRIVPAPEGASPADWPLDPAYVKAAQADADQFIAVALNAEEAALWQQNVGVSNVTFQLDGQPVSGMFVPWLPSADFAEEIVSEFPAP